VRYADTHGFEVNTPRPNAWPYRDWVIKAFNSDMPYDEFVREQIAGDTVGADAATGFLVAGPVVLPGQVGKDEASRRRARHDELAEIIKATGTSFLGLTIGCARCHDHKFDPIRQSDYYAMEAIFAGVHYGERPLRNPDKERRAKALLPKLAKLRHEVLAAEPLANPNPGADTRRRVRVDARRTTERFAPVAARYVRFTTHATNSKLEPCLDELEIYTSQGGELGPDLALASRGARATSSGNYKGNPRHSLAHINDGRYGNERSWISNERGKGWVQIQLAETRTIDRVIWGRDRNRRYRDRLPIDYEIAVSTDAARWKVVASSRDRIPYDAPRAAKRPNELAELEAEYSRLSAGDSVYAGRFEQPGVIHRLHRGDAMSPREVTPPGVPCALGSIDLPSGASDRERRVALARWLTDPANPLTARVAANRVWQHHFGAGIVDTPSDFGHMGARPTHPQLLDWLAKVLVDGHWSLAHLHRVILLSDTYQQSDAPRADAARVDAKDRLLWRFAPRRLEAEAIRDSILAVSGKLDLRMGGPGFSLFVPNTNYVRVYEPKTVWGPDTWRRMVYAHKVRMEPGGVFGAFDCPDAGQSTPKRARSTTAPQSLNLFNSTFVIQQAGLFAERITNAAPRDPVVLAFELALGRAPAAAEARAARRLVAADGLPALCRVLFNTNEFLVLP